MASCGSPGRRGCWDGSTRRSDGSRCSTPPGGPGPYGITTTPDGQLFYASLAGSHIGRIDHRTGAAEVVEPPTGGQGARRVWSDSRGRVWVSEWNAGQLGRYDPAGGRWREWKLPGANPMAYAVYVDESDIDEIVDSHLKHGEVVTRLLLPPDVGR